MTVHVPPFVPSLTVEEKALESKAWEWVMPIIKGKAHKNARNHHFMLTREDIEGELCVKFAEVVDRYLHCYDWETFTKLANKSMSNRMKDLLAMVFGTYRSEEVPAVFLPEQVLIGSYNQHMFFVSEFVVGLSELAAHIVELSINPDEAMNAALMAHVEYRNSLYVNGAGVNKIPTKVFIEATGEHPAKVRDAVKEIRRKLSLQDTEEPMQKISEEVLDATNFSGELVTQADVLDEKGMPSHYLSWRKQDVAKQVLQRFPDKDRDVVETSRRSTNVKILFEDDEENGRPTFEELTKSATKEAEEETDSTEKVKEAVAKASKKAGKNGKQEFDEHGFPIEDEEEESESAAPAIADDFEDFDEEDEETEEAEEDAFEDFDEADDEGEEAETSEEESEAEEVEETEPKEEPAKKVVTETTVLEEGTY